MDYHSLRSLADRIDSDRLSIETISTVLPSYHDAIRTNTVNTSVTDVQPQQSIPGCAASPIRPALPPVPETQEQDGGDSGLPPRRSTSSTRTTHGNSERGSVTQASIGRRTDGGSERSLPLSPLPTEAVLRWTPSSRPPLVETQPLTYTFSPFSFNTMLLLPPSDALDTRPKYNISVRLNYFIPSSYITTVRRGSLETGQIVGEFEMGSSNEHETYTVGGVQERLRDTSIKDSFNLWNDDHNYNWRFRNLHWKIVMKGINAGARCSYAPGGNVKATAPPIAIFTPRDAAPGRPRPVASARPTTLQVMPDGQAHFDEILLSVLILERRRLTPS